MEQEPDAISGFSQLKTTLSKLYPIEDWTVSTRADAMHPFAPGFCWRFFRADPEILARLGEALRNYDGSISWVFGPSSADATCLVAAKRGSGQFVGYPPMSRPEASLLKETAEQESRPSKEFMDQALADIPSLCSHLERYLRLEGVSAKSFDSRLIAPHDPPSLETAPFDFVERGMHVAWIVDNGSDGQEGTAAGSSVRRMLHFSVTEDEWRRIQAKILDNTPPAGAVTGTETDLFPLLSRIELSESAYFRRAEVELLRKDCLQARARTSDSLTIRGLDKLILICNWADHMAGDILLRAP